MFLGTFEIFLTRNVYSNIFWKILVRIQREPLEMVGKLIYIDAYKDVRELGGEMTSEEGSTVRAPRNSQSELYPDPFALQTIPLRHP